MRSKSITGPRSFKIFYLNTSLKAFYVSKQKSYEEKKEKKHLPYDILIYIIFTENKGGKSTQNACKNCEKLIPLNNIFSKLNSEIPYVFQNIFKLPLLRQRKNNLERNIQV